MIATQDTVFDLLDAIGERLEERGFDPSELYASYARSTQGIEIESIVNYLVGKKPEIRKWDAEILAPSAH